MFETENATLVASHMYLNPRSTALTPVPPCEAKPDPAEGFLDWMSTRPTAFHVFCDDELEAILRIKCKGIIISSDTFTR